MKMDYSVSTSSIEKRSNDPPPTSHHPPPAMRLRQHHDRLKVEHSIIDGVREMLQRLLANNPEIRSVIPGVIRPVRDARRQVKMRITAPTNNAWKATALTPAA